LSFAGGCTGDLDDTSDLGASGGALMVESNHCRVEGFGELSDGVSMFGEIHDEGGVPVGSWTHTTAEDDEFIGSPATLACRLNGSRVADVSGTGTWNGVPGHYFILEALDRRNPSHPVIVPGPTESRNLSATRTYSPSRWTDGSLSYPLGAQVVIPASMPVTVGNAGNQWTWLTLTESGSGETIRCKYRGGASKANPTSRRDIERGETVTLDQCQRAGSRDRWITDAALVAGAELEVTEVELHVQNGSSRFPSCRDAQTTVSVNIEVTPNVQVNAPADEYIFRVYDPSGVLVHSADGELATGDLAVALMP
jgi:hypothetical protein